ncbi:MAG: hypothetical protein U9N82_01285 [Thermodesulfobacteriota bacterium]|nr:hypothetical protein [Thermodesulfobacteriota bacterium]
MEEKPSPLRALFATVHRCQIPGVRIEELTRDFQIFLTFIGKKV